MLEPSTPEITKPALRAGVVFLLLFLFHSQFRVGLFELALEAELEILEEAEFGLADLGRLHQFDLGNDRRVNRVDLLDTDSIAHFVDGDRAGDALATQGEDHATVSQL